MFAHLKDRKFLHATAALVGAMVGVGVFGIPFVFAKAGFMLGLGWLIALAAVTVSYDLVFAELILSTSGVHQISGYVGAWLGPWARRAAFMANVLAGYGVLLAYLIVVGQFLHNILSQYIAINPDWYSIVFGVGWSLLVFARLRTVAVVDVVMMCLFGLVVAVIFVYGAGHLDMGNFRGVTWEYWFLPYGVILFALSGATAVPIQRQLLVGRERLLRPAIITAVTVVATLYLAFAFTVVGVSGDTTTPETISGLHSVLGSGIVLLGSLFGVMAISTSFLMMSTALYETFRLDYNVRATGAWLLVLAPPLLFFVSGLRNFIDIIGMVGSVAVGIMGLLVFAAWLRARRAPLRRPEWRVRMPLVLIWLLMAMFAGGIVYALVIQ